eukprot:1246791-Pleurochrysis_carterae.AAC.2
MSYKLCHPVATLPVTNGTICHICRLTEILRITRHRKIVHYGTNLYFVIMLIYNEFPNSSEIALITTSLAQVNTVEYHLAADSNLDTWGLCTLLVTHGCVFDLFLLLLVHLRNHA